MKWRALHEILKKEYEQQQNNTLIGAQNTPVTAKVEEQESIRIVLILLVRRKIII